MTPIVASASSAIARAVGLQRSRPAVGPRRPAADGTQPGFRRRRCAQRLCRGDRRRRVGEPRRRADHHRARCPRTSVGQESAAEGQPGGGAGGLSFAYAIDLPLKTLEPGRYASRAQARGRGGSASPSRARWPSRCGARRHDATNDPPARTRRSLGTVGIGAQTPVPHRKRGGRRCAPPSIRSSWTSWSPTRRAGWDRAPAADSRSASAIGIDRDRVDEVADPARPRRSDRGAVPGLLRSNARVRDARVHPRRRRRSVALVWRRSSIGRRASSSTATSSPAISCRVTTTASATPGRSRTKTWRWSSARSMVRPARRRRHDRRLGAAADHREHEPRRGPMKCADVDDLVDDGSVDDEDDVADEARSAPASRSARSRPRRRRSSTCRPA